VDIDRERENYQRLPAGIQPCFAQLPRPSYVDEHGRAFLILQDLNRYLTLEEFMRRVPQARPFVNTELAPFLIWMHTGQMRQPRPAPYGLLWELYLLPMQSHIGREFGYIPDNSLLEDSAVQHKAEELKHTLLNMIWATCAPPACAGRFSDGPPCTATCTRATSWCASCGRASAA
jgi:hypothetical protein